MRHSMAVTAFFVVSFVLLAPGDSPATVLRPAPWNVEGDQGGSSFGQSTAPAGDIDGDGYGDLLVGAPLYDGPAGADAGAAYLFRGTANGFVATPYWTYEGPQAGAQTGSVVAPAGDVNGDGYLDVIVTARTRGSAAASTRSVRTISPGPARWSFPTPTWPASKTSTTTSATSRSPSSSSRAVRRTSSWWEKSARPGPPFRRRGRRGVGSRRLYRR